MALQIARYAHQGEVGWAVHRDGRLTPLAERYPTTRAFFEGGGPEAARAAAGADLPLSEVEVLSPVTRDARFVCQATNYADHIRETGGDPAEFTNNVVFTKASSCIVGPTADIVRPPHVQLLDYEVELGLVLRRPIVAPVDVTDSGLHEWVGGLVLLNDVTARDVQVSHVQFHKSKSYRTFGPVGPWLLLPTREELGRLLDIELELLVDGEQRQKALAREMLFKPAATLSELSRVQDLDAGDLVATGTPAGVALRPPSAFVQAAAGFLKPRARSAAFLRGQLKRRQYLQPGQVVTCGARTRDGAIDLGRQTTRVIQG